MAGLSRMRRRGRPTRAEAEEAVRTLISWAGDDVTRESLEDTPKRFIKAYEFFFSGYEQEPQEILSRTFQDLKGYTDIILLKGIEVHSHCEHHIVPVVGYAHVAYVPQDKVVGLSKLARVVEVYARRLQSQERMTRQICEAIWDALEPKGVAVMVEAAHFCMTMRGIQKPNARAVTCERRGVFEEKCYEERFLEMIKS